MKKIFSSLLIIVGLIVVVSLGQKFLPRTEQSASVMRLDISSKESPTKMENTDLSRETRQSFSEQEQKQSVSSAGPSGTEMTKNSFDAQENILKNTGEVSEVITGKVVPSSGKCPASGYRFVSKWGSYGKGNGQFMAPNDITVDTLGNISITDGGMHRVQKFSSTGTYIAQWGSSAGYYGAGNGQFNSPMGIAVDHFGTIYVADGNNSRIQKFDSNGTYLTQWGSSGSGNGQFSGIRGVAVDIFGNIYTTEISGRIQKFDSNGTYLAQWGSSGSGNGQFYTASDIAIDSSGNVFVADQYNHRIQKFSSAGGYVSQWGGAGSASLQFTPRGLAVDLSGNVFVADANNSRILKFDSNGTYITQWGSSGSGNGQFDSPVGVTVDGSGNIYVIDYGNSRIQKFEPCKTFVPNTHSSGSISGRVYYDKNKNGMYNGGEFLYPGITVVLHQHGTQNTYQAVTQLNGEYSFPNVSAGIYYIALDNEGFWSQIFQPGIAMGLIAGKSHVYTVTVAPSNQLTGKDFGVNTWN